jgi:hypothetical protein
MKATNLVLASLFIVLPTIGNAQESRSPEDQIRHHLRLDPAAPFDIWSIRAKVLTIVHIGQPWQSVENAMSNYGLGRSSETQQTPCWPGDNGLLCQFKASPSDPGGKRTYWIEFFYWGKIDNQVLEDVAVTLFKDKSVNSTSKFYAKE